MKSGVHVTICTCERWLGKLRLLYIRDHVQGEGWVQAEHLLIRNVQRGVQGGEELLYKGGGGWK